MDVMVPIKVTAKAWKSLVTVLLIVSGMQDGKQEAALKRWNFQKKKCEALGITVEAIQELSQEDQIPTSEECLDVDIVQLILRAREEALVQTDAEIDNSVPVQVPSFKQLLAAMETVRDYIQSLSGMEDKITHLSILENKCYAKRSQQLRQSTLDSFIL